MDQAWFDELAELLRIPSVSADPAHSDDVRRAAEWVRDFVAGAGGDAELVETGLQPLVVGEIPASAAPEKAPTVLVYGHFDVQPAAPLDLWESDPFELTIRDGWLYGRGIADDKGQLYLLLKAAALLAGEGRLPVNVRVAADGEEEVGGHSIVDFLGRDERGADACVIFDFGMQNRDQPEFGIATRGLAYFHVRVRTGVRDLHSGLFGGAALNAAHALVDTLAAVLPRDGRVDEALRAGIVPLTEEERAAFAELTPGADVLELDGARPADEHAAEEFYLRTWAEPALDVHGIAVGEPMLQKTVLPVVAEANVSVRLAPGQEVDAVSAALERMLRDAVPEGAELEVQRWGTSPAGLVAQDSEAITLALEAFERVLGVRPLLVRSGGTLPIVPALAARGMPTVLTGFAWSSNVHSPNERLLVEYVERGVDAARELYGAFAELRTSSSRPSG